MHATRSEQELIGDEAAMTLLEIGLGAHEGDPGVRAALDQAMQSRRESIAGRVIGVSLERATRQRRVPGGSGLLPKAAECLALPPLEDLNEFLEFTVTMANCKDAGHWC